MVKTVIRHNDQKFTESDLYLIFNFVSLSTIACRHPVKRYKLGLESLDESSQRKKVIP